MKTLRMLLVLPCLWLLNGALAYAHEMGTSALVLHEQQEGSGLFVFKRTVGADGKVPPVDFSFSPGCQLRDVNTEWEENTEVIQRGSFYCEAALENHLLQATGFTRLSPELIVLANPLNSAQVHQVLNPAMAEVQLGKQPLDLPSTQYLWIGVEHILFGLDHVLFVTGLYLLWRKRQQSMKQLLGQFSLFTLGHSLTLALLVMGLVTVPVRAVEAWIALSVLWLAWELIRDEPTQPRMLWHLCLIASFGLLHGLGFALSMEQRGFPEEALLPSLLFFNLGIEAGQLWIVVLLASLFSILQKANQQFAFRMSQHLLIMSMGGAALYWTLDRIHNYV